MERNTGLDLLKIIACFACVVLHATGMVPVASAGYGLQNALYYIAGLAVPVFFMVNGALLLNKSELGYRYVSKKIANILIIVFSWNVLFFLEKLLLERITTNPASASLNSFVQGDYFWQFWFFGALVIIYLLLPLIHKLFSKIRPALALTAVLVAICLAVDTANVVRSGMGLPIVQANIPQTFRLWTWLAYFLLGGLLGKQQVREFLLRRLGVVFNLLIFAAALLIISVYQYKMGIVLRDPRAELFYDNIFTFIYVASLFVLVSRRKYSTSRQAVLSRISGNVMGIYIIHVTILLLLTRLFRISTQMEDICLIFVVYIASLAVTAFISRVPLANRLIRI